MTNDELAKEIARQLFARDDDTVSLDEEQWQQILAALRRGHDTKSLSSKQSRLGVDNQGNHRERPPSSEAVVLLPGLEEAIAYFVGDRSGQKVYDNIKARIKQLAAAKAEHRKAHHE